MKNFILKNENAIYYECGYSCDNVIFLKLGKESFFITDGRYTEEAKESINNINTSVIETIDLINTSKNLLIKNKIKTLIIDPNDFTILNFNILKEKLKINFIFENNFSMKKRIIKTNEEIKLLKKASTLGKKGFKNFAKYIEKNGFKQKENFLHFKAIENLSASGKLDLSFTPVVAINENASKPHALKTTKKLKNNDLLLVDAGVKYKRYCSDRTCTSSVNFKNFNFNREQNFKNKKYQKIYDLVLKAQQNAIKKARAGMKASEIDALARNIINDAGYGKYFIHSTGHGVGLDIHEYPIISSNSDIIIKENMVFTIEPGIYLPNEFGVRIEDCLVIKNGKAEIL